MFDNRYLTVDDLSQLLHLKVGTIRNRICLGKPMPPSVKVGRRLLFEESAFKKWMEKRTENNDGFMNDE